MEIKELIPCLMLMQLPTLNSHIPSPILPNMMLRYLSMGLDLAYQFSQFGSLVCGLHIPCNKGVNYIWNLVCEQQWVNAHYINVLYHLATIWIEVSSADVLSLPTSSQFYFILFLEPLRWILMSWKCLKIMTEILWFRFVCLCVS